MVLTFKKNIVCTYIIVIFVQQYFLRWIIIYYCKLILIKIKQGTEYNTYNTIYTTHIKSIEWMNINKNKNVYKYIKIDVFTIYEIKLLSSLSLSSLEQNSKQYKLFIYI